jgi:serine/threonine protein kinase
VEELAEGVALSDRYLLGPVVGHGAMGRVHLAEDLRLTRPVAVKSLRPQLARDAEVRERFGQEARAAARINHPNVVRVYDSGEHAGVPYLVMECLPGSTLVDELAWGRLEPRRARQVGLDVLGALEAAHRTGVIHRDVKPGNILLSATVDGPVKVSDFGIAKSTDDRSLTDPNGLAGTPAYLSPERIAGEPATPSSDIYSLGVVLYEALAGRKPYDGETSLAIALAVHMGGAPTLLELLPDIDPVLADVIDRAIAADPADRWESASAMAAALRAWRPAVLAPGDLGVNTGSLLITPTPAPTVTVLGRPPADDGPAAVLPAGVELPTAALASDERPSSPLAADEGRVAATPVSAGLDRSRPSGGEPDDDGGEPSSARWQVRALAGAGVAALLLIGALVAMAGGNGTAPVEPVTATTAAELVVGADPTTPVDDTVPADRPAAPVTTRAARRTVAPASTMAPPTSPPTTAPAPAPTTTIPPTTTAPPPVATTRPPPTTAATTTTTAPTTPSTEAPSV